MDITNPLAPTCLWMQIDSVIFNNLAGLAGWTTTFSNKVACSGTGSVATTHGSGDFTSGQIGTLPWRLEIAMITGSITTQYFTWHTNILVTDDSPGNPNVIHFVIVTASGLFQLILITTAMMYVSSGFGAVMRVFAKDKVPKFLGPKFVIVTGVVGTAGFLFMLIVGANLVHQACPPQAICTG